jgi:hypothetical protein
MPSKAERDAMISKIELLPDQVEEAVRGLNNSQLDTPYRDGGWTVRQVVHHLADSHMNAWSRMKLLMTEENPTIKPYDQEKWADLQDGKSLPIQSSLMILRGLHARMTSFLRTRQDGDWSRKGMHPESGLISLDSLLVTYSKHGENHVGQITGLRKKMGW